MDFNSNELNPQKNMYNSLKQVFQSNTKVNCSQSENNSISEI